jgi:hypothetical protein
MSAARSKYGVRTDPAGVEARTVDGIVFHSGREMKVYLQFKSMLRCGTFTDLQLQVPYAVYVTDPNGGLVQVFVWKADFVVTEIGGRQSVYDAKGFRTEVYKLKKRCVEAQYQIRIIEV